MSLAAEFGFDAAIIDKEDHEIGLIVTKPVLYYVTWPHYLSEELKKFPTEVKFVFGVDKEAIRLFRWNGSELTGPIAELNSAQILQHYEPEFARLPIFHNYLRTLVTAWLRDLAYHWKSERPPGMEELRSAGLLSKLEGGSTVSFGD
jgi:hypothetical protein